MDELNPEYTLRNIGLSAGDTFCDIGAGTGIFTYAAAKITSKDIYAVEISGEMREILHAKRDVPNVIIEDSVEKVPENSCDMALLCTVLHELADIPAMMGEVKRILKPGGILTVIEFHKRETPMGPPLGHRISVREASEILLQYEFAPIKQLDLGENFYCLIFKLSGER